MGAPPAAPNVVAMELLVLWDVDGTLLVDGARAHRRAIVCALRETYALDIPDDAVERIGPWGKTDRRIAREVLLAAGVERELIEARLGDWMAAASAHFAAAAAELEVRSGLPHELRELRAAGLRMTLLTGNLRAIAARKVERAGIAAELDLAIGAYGDDAEERAALVPLARRRAGDDVPWPRERTVVVGDTPADVAAAAADEVDCLAFDSPRFPRDRLRGAAAIVSDARELARLLAARHAG